MPRNVNKCIRHYKKLCDKSDWLTTTKLDGNWPEANPAPKEVGLQGNGNWCGNLMADEERVV